MKATKWHSRLRQSTVSVCVLHISIYLRSPLLFQNTPTASGVVACRCFLVKIVN